MAFLRSWLAGLCVALAGAAMAAPPPGIEAFDVERIAVLQPGARLNFTVFGTPRAQVQLEIEGARQILPLREADAGVYEGAYVLDPQDRIAAGSRVVATLRGADGSIVRAMLDEPLLLDGTPDARPAAPSPAWPPIAEPRTLPAPMSPSASPSIAPPISSPVPPPVQAQRIAPPPDSTAFPPGCRQCAIVESIRSVEALPSRPPRTVPGNLLGALFGEGVAERVDRHVDRVNNAVERAVNGRAQMPLPSTRYEVLLRLPNGQRLTRLYDAPPPFRTGDMLVLPQSAIGQLAQGG